jgi:hypothetical protein
MLIKKNMLTIFFLLFYIFIFYNLFIINHFKGDIYSQFPNTKTNQNLTNNNNNNNNNNSDNGKWIHYIDKKGNFTTSSPKEWEIIKSENKESNQTGHITIFRSPKENPNDIFQENIVISIKKTDKNITNNNFQIQTIIKKLASDNQDFKLENISSINIDDNQTGKSIKYDFKKLGLDFKTEQVFSITNNKIYIFSLLTEQKTFEKYAPILNFMLKNFKIIK